MQGFVRFFRGVYQIELRSAAPEGCLNAFADAALSFWSLERIDELTYRVLIYKSDFPQAKRLALRAMTELCVLRELGFRRLFYGLKRRPVLLAGVLFAVLAALLLPRFVWTVEVRGNVRLHEEQILRELDALGVHFGAWGGDIRSQEIKNQILLRLPELQWCAVNRTGGRVTVLVHERPEKGEVEDETSVTNVVATRDGVVTEMVVLEGFAVCKIGQNVSAGELLVSGYQEWTLHVQATHALAEIYALTKRDAEVVLPTESLKKVYTGRSWTYRTILLGRKRIKLSGNSRILDSNCDKIIDVKPLTLPGGYSFPVKLVTETYREYRLAPQARDENAAKRLLSQEAEWYTKQQMIGGRILQTQENYTKEDGRYILRAQYDCREMIARSVPAPIFKGDTNAADGENH